MSCHTAEFIFRNQNLEFRQAEQTKSIMYYERRPTFHSQDNELENYEHI